MLPEVGSVGEWLHPETVSSVAEHLLSTMRFDQPREALEVDVIAALIDSDNLEFEWGTAQDTSCELHGTYLRRPPRIRVSRHQGMARANFTAAHEFGHHLQQSDSEWALDVLAGLRHDHNTLSRHVEEAVSNRVAVTLLMPAAVVEEAWTGELTPTFVRALTRGGLVSRQAATLRASSFAASEDPHAVIIVADPATGVVLSSVSSDTSTLARPAKGSVQPDFRALTSGAEGHRGATTGFEYATGSARSDITYDWGWDAHHTHVFVVARPTYRFGNAQWDRDAVECSSATCDSTFSHHTATRCGACMLPICPDCGACGCEKQRGTVCMNCFTEMSLSESQRGTVHDECPI